MSTWNQAFENTPAGSESPSLGDDRFRELKSAVRERLNKEHVMDLASGLLAEDGWHESGSAKVYFQSAAPTVRPDGTTALDVTDNGRIWISSTDYKIRVYNFAAGATNDLRWVMENDALPVGTIQPFAGEVASIPTGYLLCNGQAVNRADYVTLNSILKDVGGTNAYGWGAGDGSLTFNLPDLREVAPVGVGTKASGVTAHDVYGLAQMKDDQFQGHSHFTSLPAATSGGATNRSWLISGATSPENIFTSQAQSDGSNGTPRLGSVTRGKRTGVNYIIKARSVDANYTSETANIDTRLSNIENSGFTFRNKIINGNFDFWQRGTSLALIAAGTNSTYLADRFKVQIDGTSGATTCSRQGFTIGQIDVPNNPAWYMRSLCTNGGDVTNGAHRWTHFIEDVYTFAGKQVILSFWAKADVSKTLAIEIEQCFGTGGSPSANVQTFIQKISLTTFWTKYTIPINIPSISGKTLGTDGLVTSYLGVRTWMSAGSAFAARTGTLGIQTGTFDFAQVQLEEGAVATAFEQRPPQVELALCQRYCFVPQYPGVSARLAFGIGQSTSSIPFNMPLHVPMRKAPTTSLSSVTSWVVSDTSIGIPVVSISDLPTVASVNIAAWLATVSAGAAVQYRMYFFERAGGTPAPIICDAEF